MQEGDVVILFGMNSGTGTSAVDYTTLEGQGWTKLVGRDTGDLTIIVWYKTMGATPDTDVDILIGSGGANGEWVASAFRGVDDSTTYVYAEEWTYLIGSSGNPDPPSVTTTVDDSVVVALGALDDDTISSFTPPSGYTSLIGSFGSGRSAMSAYKTIATAGTENPSAFSTSGDDDWYAMSLVLAPATDSINLNKKNTGIWSLNAVYSALAPDFALEFIEGSSLTGSLVIPASVQEGDFIICRNSGDYNTTTSVPSGFTQAYYYSGGGFPVYVSYRIAQSGDASTNLTPSNCRYSELVVYRPTKPIYTVTTTNFANNSSGTSDPLPLTVSSSTAATPVCVVFGGFENAATLTSPSWLPSNSEDVFANNGGAGGTYTTVYNIGDTPVDHTVDTGDGGNQNSLVVGIFNLS